MNFAGFDFSRASPRPRNGILHGQRVLFPGIRAGLGNGVPWGKSAAPRRLIIHWDGIPRAVPSLVGFSPRGKHFHAFPSFSLLSTAVT